MSRQPDPAGLARSFRIAYGLGLALCVAWPLALQLLLGHLIRPSQAPPPADLVQHIGYTFTGLTVALGLFVSWRSGRVRATFRSVADAARTVVMVREIILYASLFEVTALFGVLYYGLGGPERFARGFLALGPAMFLVFVPRLQAWRRAAFGE